ncbi:glucokinase [Cognatishimia sp. F0-27]|uniref:glucokinase n=1 Tax=Cognatishimia sp. F0-27 TaxID=2816855 RepID=UPI001D0C224B|nr:glucokinase [Cognatishimia sp. F0-27]MCC1492371.1 glucokinase [Cognatishimia sp. F0-27]
MSQETTRARPLAERSLAVVADVGGTNTRVALSRGTAVEPGSIKRYRNADNASLEAVLSRYLDEVDARPEAACVAIAGPVRDGVGRLTNLDWEMSRDSIGAATGAATVAILNDLQAQGHALPFASADSFEEILPGTHGGTQGGAHAAKLVIGVGTGLNAALVYRLGDRTLVPPAEAGHVSLPVQSEEELRLLAWLARKHGTPGVEEVLSGRGFANLHAWICLEDGSGTPLAPDALMQAFHAGDPQAARAVALFVRLLGRYAGNLALIALPFGGIYFCGGVARHFGPMLCAQGFAEAFRDKGRFGPFMEQFAVSLVTDDYAALSGCAAHLAELETAQDA